MRLIDADALRKVIQNDLDIGDNVGDDGYYNAMYMCLEYIDKAPIIEERPTGEWIRYRDNPHQPEHIKCSICGQYWSIADHDKTFEYCFKCGAKIKEAENE